LEKPVRSEKRRSSKKKVFSRPEIKKEDYFESKLWLFDRASLASQKSPEKGFPTSRLRLCMHCSQIEKKPECFASKCQQRF